MLQRIQASNQSMQPAMHGPVDKETAVDALDGRCARWREEEASVTWELLCMQMHTAAALALSCHCGCEFSCSVSLSLLYGLCRATCSCTATANTQCSTHTLMRRSDTNSTYPLACKRDKSTEPTHHARSRAILLTRLSNCEGYVDL